VAAINAKRIVQKSSSAHSVSTILSKKVAFLAFELPMLQIEAYLLFNSACWFFFANQKVIKTLNLFYCGGWTNERRGFGKNCRTDDGCIRFGGCTGMELRDRRFVQARRGA
jgi:hypothetical protein